MSLKCCFGECVGLGEKEGALPADVFADKAIPDPEDGASSARTIDYTQEDRKALSRLADELVCEIVQGQGISIFFDNDGTLFRFRKDPKDVAIDVACYEALLRLSHLPGVRAVSLTGREVHEARDLMLTPGLEVRDSSGLILTQAGVKRLYFSIVGSHGVQCLSPDGSDGGKGVLEQYEFSPEEKGFVEQFQSMGRAFESRYSGLTVEIKHGSLGVNVSTLACAPSECREVYNALLHAIEGLVGHPDAPTRDGRRIFNIRKEGANEFEVRPTAYGKDFGITTFGGCSPGRKTLFLCDSLGDHGTDTPAAALVNSLGGDVLMVLNGRNEPPDKNSPACPRAVFANPTMLGRFLKAVATKAEQALGPKPHARPIQALTFD